MLPADRKLNAGVTASGVTVSIYDTDGPNYWAPVAGTPNIRFHIRWTNPDEDAQSGPINGQMSSQHFGVRCTQGGAQGGELCPRGMLV